jgi:hypothetical protein
MELWKNMNNMDRTFKQTMSLSQSEKWEIPFTEEAALPVTKASELASSKTSQDLSAAVMDKKVDSQAMRFDDNKLRFDLIPPEVIIELARVYTMGSYKYNDDNWRQGMPWSKVIRPVFSHMYKWMSGIAIDSDTGCHNLIMVAWNALTLFMYELHKVGKDTRQKFDIDENFKWTNNHLNIGLDDSQITDLKNKYRLQNGK